MMIKKYNKIIGFTTFIKKISSIHTRIASIIFIYTGALLFITCLYIQLIGSGIGTDITNKGLGGTLHSLQTNGSV